MEICSKIIPTFNSSKNSENQNTRKTYIVTVVDNNHKVNKNDHNKNDTQINKMITATTTWNNKNYHHQFPKLKKYFVWFKQRCSNRYIPFQGYWYEHLDTVDSGEWTYMWILGPMWALMAPIELELTERQNEHQILAWMGDRTMVCGIFPWKLFLCENNSLVRQHLPTQRSSCHPLSLDSSHTKTFHIVLNQGLCVSMLSYCTEVVWVKKKICHGWTLSHTEGGDSLVGLFPSSAELYIHCSEFGILSLITLWAI